MPALEPCLSCLSAKPRWDGVEMSEPLSALHCESFIQGV